MTLINTMSQAGYMTILFVVIFASIGLCVLLFFLSRHERKRFKETRLNDKSFKPVDFETELKKRVSDANGKTKFTVITFILENIHGIKQLYTSANVDGMLDVVASRLKRIIKHSSSVAVQDRKQITLFISKNVPQKELVVLAEKAINDVKKPIAMPDSRQVFLELNVASVYYPGDGTEPVRLLNNLQTAMATARRKGLSQYVAYTESLDEDVNNIGAYFEYQRQMIAKNVGIYFRRVIQEGTVNSSILESQMRYRREEMNQAPILDIAIQSNDELWLGRYFYEHSMSQLKRINNKTSAHKKLIIRLSDSQIKDESIIPQLSKAINNNGIAYEDIIVGLDCIKLKELGKDLMTFTKLIKDENLCLLLYNIDMTQRADQLSAMGVDYLELDARAITDSTVNNINLYLDEMRNAKITVMAGGIDKAEYVKPIRDLGIKFTFGEMLSTYLTVKEILSN